MVTFLNNYFFTLYNDYLTHKIPASVAGVNVIAGGGPYTSAWRLVKARIHFRLQLISCLHSKQKKLSMQSNFCLGIYRT